MAELLSLPEPYGTEILRVEVGSTLHGTGLGVALEDHDEIGIFVEHPASTIGLDTREHYVKRTAPDGERSQAGDIDLVVYSLRKWARLALNGNPSVILLFFAPTDKIMLTTPLGDGLRERAEWFASLRAGKAFLGYMEQQRQRMVGLRGRAGRVRVMPDGEIDWKYAMHMLRLGHQGVEYLTTGHLTLPVPGNLGDHLRSVRQGLIPFAEVIAEAEALEAEVKALLDGGSPLPAQPESERVEKWIIAAHLRTWELPFEMQAVVHRAWHLMDDSGESEHDNEDIVVDRRDHDRLSEAFDVLEATGWDAHPETA